MSDPGAGSRRADRARRVAGVLRRQIAAGTYPTGLLPDERQLAAEFAASRNAVREALRQLGDEGLVERRRGTGTVVLLRPYRHPLDELAGLGRVLAEHGTVVNEVRAARSVQPPPEVARRLRLEPGQPVVHLERLRSVDGGPVSLDCTYLAPDVGGPLLALPAATLRNEDVFSLLETVCGVRLGTADITVQAATADPATAEVLAMPGTGALFLVERLTRLADGRPVDLEFLYLRGDRVALHGVLGRGHHGWRPTGAAAG